jgi:NAD-dependent dihydropyrimidine dehydrogenase PreA subunit
MGFNPIVDKEKCTGCGTCVNICPVNVFELKDGKSEPIRAKDCIGCKACEVNCPTGAIKVEEKE